MSSLSNLILRLFNGSRWRRHEMAAAVRNARIAIALGVLAQLVACGLGAPGGAPLEPPTAFSPTEATGVQPAWSGISPAEAAASARPWMNFPVANGAIEGFSWNTDVQGGIQEYSGVLPDNAVASMSLALAVAPTGKIPERVWDGNVLALTMKTVGEQRETTGIVTYVLVPNTRATDAWRESHPQEPGVTVFDLALPYTDPRTGKRMTVQSPYRLRATVDANGLYLVLMENPDIPTPEEAPQGVLGGRELAIVDYAQDPQVTPVPRGTAMPDSAFAVSLRNMLTNMGDYLAGLGAGTAEAAEPSATPPPTVETLPSVTPTVPEPTHKPSPTPDPLVG